MISLFITSRKRSIFTLRSVDIIAHVLLEGLVASFDRPSICVQGPLFPILDVNDFAVGEKRVNYHFFNNAIYVLSLRRVVLLMLHPGNLVIKSLDRLQTLLLKILQFV